MFSIFIFWGTLLDIQIRQTLFYEVLYRGMTVEGYAANMGIAKSLAEEYILIFSSLISNSPGLTNKSRLHILPSTVK